MFVSTFGLKNDVLFYCRFYDTGERVRQKDCVESFTLAKFDGSRRVLPCKIVESLNVESSSTPSGCQTPVDTSRPTPE